MADITKLASMFKAARLKVGVNLTSSQWEALARELKRMGLEPKVFDVASGRIWFSVVVPLSYDPLPPHVPIGFCQIIDRFDSKAEGIGSGKTIDLICPPEREVLPSRITPRIEECPICGRPIGLIPVCVNESREYYAVPCHDDLRTGKCCRQSGTPCMQQHDTQLLWMNDWTNVPHDLPAPEKEPGQEEQQLVSPSGSGPIQGLPKDSKSDGAQWA